MTTMTEATTHTLDVRDAVLSYDRARWRPAARSPSPSGSRRSS
jgi:hypothetical protein